MNETYATGPENSWQTEAETGVGTVTAAAVGKDLFIEISSTADSFAQGEFARLDNVYLSVIPEPSAYGLIAGFLGLSYVMLRRRS